ncbi:MAG: N-acetyltransferase [Oleiphilus sp.]|nr:MAG: N-acetyltransferase [Oleiphilus sp.]
MNPDKHACESAVSHAQEAVIRQIEKKDNAQIASIIREVLTEYGANRPGFAWQDPELDDMSGAYDCAGRSYWVIESGGVVVGGGGVAEFECEMPAVCELQKMYLLPKARGRSLGYRLLSQVIEQARHMGYERCYLETLNSMTEAGRLYQKMGFSPLTAPMGNSGHNACDNWYLKTLKVEI